MNITLVGYGKMGHEIASLVQSQQSQNMTIVSIIDPHHPQATHKNINAESTKNTDVCIDFSSPDVVINNISACADLQKNMVIGTTGWYANLDRAKKIVENTNIGLIYASNFSLGVNIFYKIIENAAKIMNSVNEYDVFVNEWHHKGKKDSPSGTALSIGSILLKNLDRKKTIITDKLDRAPLAEELHLSSTRGGSIPGTHAVYFDSDADTIELKHTARNRQGFALGALKCSKWIYGKKGLFAVEDWINDIL